MQIDIGANQGSFIVEATMILVTHASVAVCMNLFFFNATFGAKIWNDRAVKEHIFSTIMGFCQWIIKPNLKFQ